MTFRTRTVQKRTRRPARRSETRRALYLNIAFVIAIVLAVGSLAAVVGSGWYNDHLTAIATVNGQSISKDDVRARHDVLAARYNRQIAMYLDLRNKGKITSDEYNNLVANVQSQAGTTPGSQDATTLYTTALSQLTEEAELAQYASKNGISVTDQQVNAEVSKDSTVPEMRHLIVIATQPQPTPPAVTPTQAEIDAAQAQAQKYLDEIKAGKKPSDVLTEAGTPGGQGTTGDLGLHAKTDFSLEPDILDAAFALAKPNDVTPIVKGSDNIYRFAIATSIVPATPDPDFQSSISSAASWSAYQASARGEAIKTAVEAAINKQYIDEPTKQRHVLEIAVQGGLGAPNEDEVKVKMLVFAPNHSTSDAPNIAKTDAAWTDAKKRADSAIATLQKDPSQFATIAKGSDNDDPYFKTTGGDVPWLPQSVYASDGTQSAGLNMAPLGTELFKPGLTLNQLVGPVETPVGYVIAKYEGTRASANQRIADAALLVESGTDFSTEAKAISETPDAAQGGDMGWVSPYQLEASIEQQIFALPIGRISSPATPGNSNGLWIFKVVGEETRKPDAAQAVKLRQVVFGNWLTQFKTTQNVWNDPAGAGSLAPSASPSAS